MSSDVMNRADSLAAAGDGRDPFDVLVIGGGIVGAGVARDAAMRGLRTVLVEQRDLASGTSSRSSRLLHGGLRYLAQGRFGLVRQAQREKRTILRLAPHLVQPLPFIFPAPRAGPWKPWKLRIGVRLYDWLCGEGNFGTSGALSMQEVRECLPQLDATAFRGAVRYFDAMTDDARLVIDTCRSAASHGAQILNYVQATSVQAKSKLWQAQLHDRIGEQGLGLVARTVVNACGPWADRWPASAARLRLTKGVHLVIDRRRLAVPEAVVLTDGPRIVFVLPWGARVILGTTDTDYSGNLEEPPCDREDVEYLLSVVNRAFPSAALGPAAVMSTWSGLRPLVRSGQGGPSDIDRSHRIRSPQPGWFDVTGGKLTTYRLMAQDTVDRLVEYLDRPVAPCRTAAEPLLAAGEAVQYNGVIPAAPGEQSVRRACSCEWAVRLEDVMIRRTSWSRYFPGDTDLAQRVAVWMASALGWDANRRQRELDEYRALVKHQMACVRPAGVE
jgi:glycerol-3-phosphate dehydrogenase